MKIVTYTGLILSFVSIIALFLNLVPTAIIQVSLAVGLLLVIAGGCLGPGYPV